MARYMVAMQDGKSDLGLGDSVSEADAEGCSDQGSSYAHISQPASMQSMEHLDAGSPSRPVSLASFQELQSQHGDDAAAWDVPEVGFPSWSCLS